MTTAALAPAASHLWQSTLFAGVTGLLVLALRSNQARARYWLWLAASYKFLLSFSWLVRIGHLFQWRAAPTITSPTFSVVTSVLSGPDFLTMQPAGKSAPDHFTALLFTICAVWACGFLIVATGWFREWLRLRAIVRRASPLPLGLPIQVVSTPARLEPGVFGIVRPVLLLPEGIAARLTPAQLQAVIAHELCHVRRRDNLAASVHMLVEALFWFHPLVWWLGARLVDERENACDEEVLKTGSQAEAYAESILKVCEFYLGSPLTCMSGVTGSDLKERIQRIMKNRFGIALSGRKRLLLVTLAAAALVLPVIVGVLTSPILRAQTSTAITAQPRFDATSVKANKSGDQRVSINIGQPGGRVVASNVPLRMILMLTYQLPASQILGVPDWSDSEHFDIEARAEGNPTAEQKRLMLQTLLADRFKLVAHHETKELSVYALVVAKPGKLGPKLIRHSNDDECADASTGSAASGASPSTTAPAVPCGGISVTAIPGGMHYMAKNLTIERFVTLLGGAYQNIDHPIIDRTDLSGTFDFTLDFAPLQPTVNGTSSDPLAPPSIFTAVQDQLGLKLETQKSPVDVLIIDHVEQPTPN